MLRVVDNLLSWAFLDDNAAIHKRNAIGNVTSKRHFMCHDNHGHVLVGKLTNNAQDLLRKLWVERRRGFIEEQHIRVKCDGVSFAVNQIIPILDTLEMAANAPTTDENYKKGVTMTLDKAAKALDVLHVEEIEALGKPFDPNFMNAVQQIPAPDGQESGTVITVYQKGYRLGDKIVRHATVVVAE